MTIKKIEAKASEIIKAAQDENFFGKRLRSKKLALAEMIIADLEIKSTEQGELVDWLDAHKPVKAKKAKAEKVNVEPIVEGTEQLTDETIKVLPYGTYLVTTVQNNTTPSTSFSNLQVLAASLQANIIALPMQYNAKAYSAAVKESRPHFDPIFNQYLQHSDCWIGERGAVKLVPTASVLPTAKMPINACASLNNGENITIIAGAKLQAKTLPRLQGGDPRWCYVTGASTSFNYTDTRAGREAQQSHDFAAILINVDESGLITHCTIKADDKGSLYFGDNFYCDGTEYDREQDPFAVLGDLHSEMKDQFVWDRTIEWLESVKPCGIAVHDVFHMMSRNHHNRKSGKFLFSMQDRTVLDDLKEVVNSINELASIAPVYIVESNHDDALDQWLDATDYNPSLDQLNAKLYHFLKYSLYQSMEEGEDLKALELALRELVGTLPQLHNDVEFGRAHVQHVVYGYDVSQHGHNGSNGSRGNVGLLSKMQVKMVTGHTHSPTILNGLFTVGVTAKLDQGYNRNGFSSWDHANVLIQPNGECQMFPLFAIGEQTTAE